MTQPFDLLLRVSKKQINISLMKRLPNFENKILNALKLISFGIVSIPSIYNAQTATSTIDINTPVMSNPKLLLGITYDCRSSLSNPTHPVASLIGYHNTDGTFIPELDAVFHDFPMSTLRYPGNGIAYGFEWKNSIGNIANRTPQNVFANLNPTPFVHAQTMEFGFDEFMAMTAARGVDPSDIQIMVPIYDVTDPTLISSEQTDAAIPNMIQSNADWVEYANAPNDGSNPGGGTDWAAIRAANGHAAPYGIKLWNMGNEPYHQNEFGPNGANNYIAAMMPIIDAMRAIDPSIKITLTVEGKLSLWTTTILNSPLLQGKIYGINAHYFLYDNAINGTILAGVDSYSNYILALTNAAQQQGYKVIIGDHAYTVVASSSVPTAIEMDYAMQWHAANKNADFILMMSQTTNIDRANFWIYGMPGAQWHPIRKNSDGSYTSLPAAELYKKLSPLFLDESITVTSTSPVSSDGNPYSIRSSAFLSSDRSKLNVISVNRDLTNTIPLQLNGINGYTLSNSKILSANALNSDTIIESPIFPDNNGDFTLPPLTVLMLEYTESVGDVSENSTADNSLIIYPNPVNNNLNFSENLEKFSVTNSLGQEILKGNGKSVSTSDLANGIYFLKTNETCLRFIVKH